MIVDDRLDTVLRTPAAGAAASRIRYRQLVDLLGRLPGAQWGDVHFAALVSLDQFGEQVAETERARVIETSVIRSVPLVRHLATAEPRVAGAAIAAARLSEDEWLGLIPQLPVRARGFLRHRRDLGASIERLLQRFGIGDFALPLPAGYEAEAVPAAPTVAATVVELPASHPAPAASDNTNGIGAIVRRIEAFRRARSEHRDAGGDPRLPFADEPVPAPSRLTEIQFRTDEDGALVWADGAAQALLFGHRPFTAEAEAPARCDLGTLRCVKGRAPIRAGRLEIEGAESVAGAWRIDAIPLFADRGGRFTGYLGRLRRPAEEAAASVSPGNDRLRQLLHELRTPVNAIQGFAELIQQQIFGPTPHEYRSLAASIAADAARILGGFEDIDRMVRMETGHMAPDEGQADLGDVLARLVAQLEPVIAPRAVRLKVERADGAMPTALEDLDLERMLWRVLAVIGSAAQPGERLRIVLTREKDDYLLSLPLPAALAAREDEELFAPDSARAAAFPSTAMLGSGFALRLAAAEAGAAGGEFRRDGARILITLPGLTEPFGNPSHVEDAAAGKGLTAS
jgi:signal transduction histidine kinase